MSRGIGPDRGLSDRLLHDSYHLLVGGARERFVKTRLEVDGTSLRALAAGEMDSSKPKRQWQMAPVHHGAARGIAVTAAELATEAATRTNGVEAAVASAALAQQLESSKSELPQNLYARVLVGILGPKLGQRIGEVGGDVCAHRLSARA